MWKDLSWVFAGRRRPKRTLSLVKCFLPVAFERLLRRICHRFRWHARQCAEYFALGLKTGPSDVKYVDGGVQ